MIVEVAPRAQRAVEALSTLGTRATFLVVPWLLLADGISLPRLALVVVGQALAYALCGPICGLLLAGAGAARVSLAAELASALVLAGFAFAFAGIGVAIPMAVLLGAVRAVADRAREAVTFPPDSTQEPTPPREAIVGVLTILVGAAIGAVVAWLGPTGALWLTAAVFLTCAILAGWTAPDPAAVSPGAADPADTPGRPDPLNHTDLLGRTDPAVGQEAAFAADPTFAREPALTRESALARESALTRESAYAEEAGFLPRPMLAAEQVTVEPTVPAERSVRLLVALFAANLLVQAGAVLLVAGWQRSLMPSIDQAGFLGGAVLVGALGAAVVFTAFAFPPLRCLLLAIGYLIGGGALLLARGLEPFLLLVFAVAIVAGVALSSVTPMTGKVLPRPAVALAYLGLPLGTIAAAALLPELGLGWVVAIGAALYLAAMLVPVFDHRRWRRLAPQTPPRATVLGAGKLPARMSVTLAYADGQWLVEVRKGRALLGSRHPVRSAEALRMLALLDVPTVHNGVEQALTTDQDEAARQVDRVRGQLAELEAKLTGLREMVDLTETQKVP